MRQAEAGWTAEETPGAKAGWPAGGTPRATPRAQVSDGRAPPVRLPGGTAEVRPVSGQQQRPGTRVRQQEGRAPRPARGARPGVPAASCRSGSPGRSAGRATGRPAAEEAWHPAGSRATGQRGAPHPAGNRALGATGRQRAPGVPGVPRPAGDRATGRQGRPEVPHPAGNQALPGPGGQGAGGRAIPRRTTRALPRRLPGRASRAASRSAAPAATVGPPGHGARHPGAPGRPATSRPARPAARCARRPGPPRPPAPVGRWPRPPDVRRAAGARHRCPAGRAARPRSAERPGCRPRPRLASAGRPPASTSHRRGRCSPGRGCSCCARSDRWSSTWRPVHDTGGAAARRPDARAARRSSNR